MSMTKIATAVFLSILLIVLGSQVRFFWGKNGESETRYQKISTELKGLKTDFEKTQADFNYYLNPDNLEKEIRARFNYRSFGEKMFIIIPTTSSTSQQ